MPATEPTIIALLYEQGVTRSALAQHITGRTAYTLLCAVADGPALKRACAVGPAPSVVLLGSQYRELVPWVAQHLPDAAVLVLGPELPDEDHIELFRTGAQAFCCEKCELDELLGMVDQVRQGAVHFSRTALARIRAQLAVAPRLALDRPVSERQEEFLRLLISPEAPTYERIAELMDTGVNMVYKHRNKLCARFGLKGKSALVGFGVRYFAGSPAG